MIRNEGPRPSSAAEQPQMLSRARNFRHRSVLERAAAEDSRGPSSTSYVVGVLSLVTSSPAF